VLRICAIGVHWCAFAGYRRLAVAAHTRWIFFDLGHTLVDEDGAHRARLERLTERLVNLGLSLTVEELWTRVERASEAFEPFPYLAVLGQLGLTPQVAQQLRSEIRYDHGAERLYPGVPGLLAELSKHFALGLIANQSLGTEQRLLAYGIAGHFSVVAASAELDLQKPDLAIFQWALDRAGCAPEAAVMVGDRIDNDVAPANQLGMRSMRVLQGFARVQRPRSLAETPDHTIATIAELATDLAL